MNTKLFFLALVFSCIGLHSIAQTKYLQKELDHQGNVSFARLSADSFPQPVSKSAELLKNMYSMRNTDGLKPSEIRKKKQDELGYTHQYYQQYYRNVKVENGEVSVHANRDGNIESIFGYFKPVGDVDTKPQLSESQALQYALKHIGAEVYKWQIPEEEQWIKEYFNSTYYPVGELVVVKDWLKTDRNYRLAYRFDIYAHQPMSRDYVWVDAITGDIIDMATRIMFANANGTAATRYSGTRTITTDSYNGSYRLRATKNGVNISTFNMNHTGNYTSTDFTDNDNNWTTAEHSANNNNAGLDAHWGAEMTYEYFKQKHLRNSWNDNGGALLSYVNGDIRLIFQDPNESNDNAFWDGSRMTYGRGDFLPPLTTLDICAHEIGHGIFQSEVNYKSSTGEFGAINESLSDIWGACVENWATTNKQTWLCGEDLGVVARSMSNPNLFGQPSTYGGINWWNPTNLTWDNGGVHRNSGVMNFWFHLLAVGGSGINDIGNAYNVIGIGIDKAAKIVYRAETDYMSASTDFANARNTTINAARDFYGYNSQEIVSVTDAWHAVGIGDRHPAVITGPDLLCLKGESFTAINVPAGFTWAASSNLTITGSGNSVVIGTNINYTSGSSGWVSINLNGVEQTKKNIWIGYPNVKIDGPDNVNSFGSYTAFYNTLSNPIFYWNINGSQYLYSIGNYAEVQFNKSGTYTITLNACNTCGYGAEVQKTVIAKVFSPGHEITYSNPANDLLNIYIKEDKSSQPSLAPLITDIETTGAPLLIADDKKSNVNNPTFDIRLYNEMGVQVRQTTAKKGGKVQFNVSNLPNGNYYLHIYDGVNAKPEMKQIIIKH